MKYGKGEKSKVTVEQVLQAAKVGQAYLDKVGNGLSIGGVNATTFDKVFRIPEGTTELEILAPELDPVVVTLEFDEVEVERPIKTAEYQAQQLAQRQQAEAEAKKAK